MKQIINLTGVFIILAQSSVVQRQSSFEQMFFIEETEYAQKKIVPDELYLSNTIIEHETGRDKITVDQPYQTMKDDILLPLPEKYCIDANGYK